MCTAEIGRRFFNTQNALRHKHIHKTASKPNTKSEHHKYRFFLVNICVKNTKSAVSKELIIAIIGNKPFVHLVKFIIEL